ncbi:MAG: murein biosynthesis integral membrane protein MurJ [Gammaproteobacteria bacterium]
MCGRCQCPGAGNGVRARIIPLSKRHSTPGTPPLTKALLRSTAVVGQMTMISRVLGFVRDVVIARFFGANLAADAFFVAFKIPNLFRRLFAEGAFAQAFVPVLAEYRERDGDAGVGDLVGAVAGTLALVLLAVVTAGVLAAPALIFVFAPGFADEPDKRELAVALLRLTFPYLGFISLTALAGGVLNTYGRFAIPAFTPVLLNVALIGAALLLAPGMERPVMALGIGVFVGGVAQLALQLGALARLGLAIRPLVGFAHAGVQQILRLMLPALFGVSVAQLNLMLDTIIASFLETGSISWLYYADRLVEFPLGVFGIALATVILPTLSARHSEGDAREFSTTLDWALRWVFLIGLPAAGALAVLAAPIITTLFAYGEFGARDVGMATRSLVAYSGGLMGFILIKVLAPGYFARQDTRTPVRVGVIAMLANAVLNLLLIVPLAHAGLALATTLSAALNAALLWRGLRRDGVYRPGGGWAGFLARVVLATAIMCAALAWWVEPAGIWLAAGVAARAVDLLFAVAGGAAIYFLALGVFGLRPRDMAARAPGV